MNIRITYYGHRVLGQLEGYFAPDYDRNNINTAACNTYQVAPPIPGNPRLPPSSFNPDIRYTATHRVYKAQYQLVATYNYGGNPTFDQTYGAVEITVLPIGATPIFSASVGSLINVPVGGAPGNSATYEFRLIDGFPVSWEVKLVTPFTSSNDATKPNYMSLVTGYGLDPRVKPPKPKITPAEDGVLGIGYYRLSDEEPVAEITTIKWKEYKYQLVAGQEITINLENAVLGTLYLVKGSYASFNQIIALNAGAAYYRYADYLPGAIDQLFAAWLALYNTAASEPPQPSLPNGFVVSSSRTVTTTEIARVGKTADVTKKWRNSNPIIGDLIWSPIPP